MTSHVKTYPNGFPFSKGNPFTRHFSFVQKKFASVRMAWAIRSKRKSSHSTGCVIRSQNCPTVRSDSAPVQKNLHQVSAVWSSVHKNHPSEGRACAIRSEKLSIHSNSCGIHSEKNLNLFERLGHPLRNVIHPFKASIIWNCSFKRFGS